MTRPEQRPASNSDARKRAAERSRHYVLDGCDWLCACGYDFYGGTAAYSRKLFEAHLRSAQ